MLSNYKLYTSFMQDVYTETINQQVEKFNTASNGAIVLRPEMTGENIGNFHDQSFYKHVQLVVARNPNVMTPVTALEMTQDQDTSVKIARRAGPVNFPFVDQDWRRVMADGVMAFAAVQIALQDMQDKLNMAVSAISAALSSVTAVSQDVSAQPTNLTTFTNGAGLFGDQSQRIRAWIMHSNTDTKVLAAAQAGTNLIYNFGNVAIRTDTLGRPFIITDSPALVVTGTPNKYVMLGLVGGAADISTGSVMRSVIDEVTGLENINRVYQAEWVYNLMIKGFAWNKTAGGAAPTAAAVATAANWTRNTTDIKDLAGVRLLVQ